MCIDSKFPLANYHRMCDATEAGERQRAERSFAADVETHIRAISSRYVVPDEGTFDFAVMYVPAEGIYGEILRLHHRKRPLPEIAIGARVVPMSPLLNRRTTLKDALSMMLTEGSTGVVVLGQGGGPTGYLTFELVSRLLSESEACRCRR